MRTLMVAAGGGGDALGALLVAAKISGVTSPPVVATTAWERLRVDPVPGPRGHDGFLGLEPIEGRAVEVTASSDTSPSGRSSLPRLAKESGARVVLLDLDQGARGVAGQLAHLVGALDIDHVTIVDIGGDAVAVGDEDELKSPLADALILSGAADLPVSVDVIVAGPGLDDELSEAEAITRLHQLNAKPLGAVRPPTDNLSSVLAWHPSEASALLATAALGIRGGVDMRRGEQPVHLTDRSARAWRSSLRSVLGQNRYAAAIHGTTSFAEAETRAETIGPTEMPYERRRGAQLEPDRIGLPDDLASRVQGYARDATMKGADLATTRRIAESTDVPGVQTRHLVEMLDRCPDARLGYLWNLQILAATPAGLYD